MGRAGRSRDDHRDRRRAGPAADALPARPQAPHTPRRRLGPGPLRLPPAPARCGAVRPRRGAARGGRRRGRRAGPLQDPRRQCVPQAGDRNDHRAGPRRRSRRSALRTADADGRSPRRARQRAAGLLAGGRLQLHRDARRRAPVGDGPLPGPRALRAWSLPDGHRVLRLRAVEPRVGGARRPHRPRHGLRHGGGQHARHGLLRWRVRRVQPGADGRRLRRRRDSGSPAMGAAQPRRHGRTVLLRHHPALRGRHPTAEPGGHHSPVGDPRLLGAGLAGRHLQRRLHPRVARRARSSVGTRGHELGAGTHRRRRHDVRQPHGPAQPEP